MSSQAGAVNFAEIYYTTKEVAQAALDFADENLQSVRRLAPGAYEAALQLAGTSSQVAVARLGGSVVTSQMEKALRAHNTHAFLDALDIAGLATPLPKGTKPKTVTLPNGRTYPSAVLNVHGQKYLTARHVQAEVQPFFTQPAHPNIAQRVISQVNGFGLKGPLDAAFHSANIAGTLIATTPYIGTDLVSRTIGNTPFTKWLTGLVHLLTTDVESPDNLKLLRQMSRGGMIPERFGSETLSRRLAAQTGAHLSRASFGAMLNGPHGIDIKSRLIMYRVSKHVNPTASLAQHAAFVNQLGLYNKALESQLARAAKGSQLAPFFTAGSQMLKNAFRANLGTSPLPTEGTGFTHRSAVRLQQQFGGGVLALAAVWFVLHTLLTGKQPQDDPDARLLELPVPDKYRHRYLMDKLYGKNERKAYVGVGFFNPLADRFIRASGIQGYFNTRQLGGTRGQGTEEGAKDAVNSLIHPFTTGPFVRGAITAATGKEPQIVKTRDYSGKFSPELRSAEIPPAGSFPAQVGRNVLEGGLTVNPLVHSIAHNLLGINAVEKKGKGGTPPPDTGSPALQTIVSMLLPHLVKSSHDNARATTAIKKEAKAIETRASGRVGIVIPPPSSGRGRGASR